MGLQRNAILHLAKDEEGRYSLPSVKGEEPEIEDEAVENA
jgi:hypothetical protein